MLFELGTILMTGGVRNLLKEEKLTDNDINTMISRHVSGDFGNLCKEDKKCNEEAIKDGEHILSKYIIGEESFYVITEWNRSVTTVLLCAEY